MSLAMNCYKLISTKVNNVYRFGGYVTRSMASIEDFKIKWKRPEPIPEIHPQQSGDLGLDIQVDPSEIKFKYQNSKELINADDHIKKMFSVGFNGQKEIRNLKRERIMALVKRHICDRGSTESQIAAMTSEIHDIQKVIQEHPKNRKMKIFLKELIEKRKKYLRLLRKWDYGRFEWILERPNLVYVPQPLKIGPVSRKESIRKITQSYCDDIIEKKLEDYKAKLKEQQKLFYAEKVQKLEFILKEEIECGLTPTVTQEDIDEARKKATELLQ